MHVINIIAFSEVKKKRHFLTKAILCAVVLWCSYAVLTAAQRALSTAPLSGRFGSAPCLRSSTTACKGKCYELVAEVTIFGSSTAGK